MSPNFRISLNVLASYGRSLFSLICGLFTARWVLQSLGKVDYGLYSLVGGLIGFIATWNYVLASAISRFYAYSVGKVKANNNYAESIIECRQWFSIAMLLHTTLAVVLVTVGYPIGVWAVRNWLTIPTEKVEVCIWLWRFVCMSCFVNIANVPFSAMYRAKQYIAELTLYSIAQTCCAFAFVYYMVRHPADWLLRYSMWMCIVGIVPQVMIALRAIKIFPECRFHYSLCKNYAAWKEFGAYVGWQFYSAVAGLSKNQGMTVILNKFFGPVLNAAQGIAATVNNQANALSAALIGAFSPAITSELGAGSSEKMQVLSYRASKYSLLLSLVFVLPLAVEISEVLKLWLKDPPIFAVALCLTALGCDLIEKSISGQWIAIHAAGKIGAYQMTLCTIGLFTLPIAILTLVLGGEVYGVCSVSLFMCLVNAIGNVLFARKLVGMSARVWLVDIVKPVMLCVVVAGLAGYLVRYVMGPTLIRVIITTIVTEIVFLPLAWFFAMNVQERAFIIARIASYAKKFKTLL